MLVLLLPLFQYANSLVCLVCSDGKFVYPHSRTFASPLNSDCHLRPFSCTDNDTFCIAGSLTFPKAKSNRPNVPNVTLSGCHNVKKTDVHLDDNNCQLMVERFPIMTTFVSGELKFCLCDRDFCNGRYLEQKIYETTKSLPITTVNPDYDEQIPTEIRPEAESRLPLMAKLALFNQQSNTLRTLVTGKKGNRLPNFFLQSSTAPAALVSGNIQLSSEFLILTIGFIVCVLVMYEHSSI